MLATGLTNSIVEAILRILSVDSSLCEGADSGSASNLARIRSILTSEVTQNVQITLVHRQSHLKVDHKEATRYNLPRNVTFGIK